MESILYTLNILNPYRNKTKKEKKKIKLKDKTCIKQKILFQIDNDISVNVPTPLTMILINNIYLNFGLNECFFRTFLQEFPISE